MRTILKPPLLAVVVVVAVIVIAVDARIGDAFKLCNENEFYDDNTKSCEPCTECKHSHYERQACSTFRDTVCGWCGSMKPERNADFFRRCHWKLPAESLEEKHFEQKFRERVMNSLLLESGSRTNEEEDLFEDEDDNAELPPLPTDDYEVAIYFSQTLFFKNLHFSNIVFDQQIVVYLRYGEEEDEKFDVPASEEELKGMKIVDHVDLRPAEPYEDDDEVPSKKRDFAPISGKEFLRRDGSAAEDDFRKLLEDDNVEPVAVNEAKIGDEKEEETNDSDELYEENDRVNIVAIAIRGKAKADEEMENYQSVVRYASNCHFLGAILYMICFAILLAVVFTRCSSKSAARVPVMNFTDEQRAMIHRCARSIPKGKEVAIYDNDIAYV
ncbi:unnamed protein product [Nippostrongylus brasiliensis]|uniref:TNFR-Cys domain-containing protein n=1 Tax=Nippostrongylus brasiliensis TaxID=27835 RepID=A0A0N4XWW1_NIPBR|nr:unnamed protein product [Nippostrongylus brasiliensis]